MRNKKKKLGLIVLFSCMFVVSVAFAAFSGVLTINGTVDIMANPFKMIFTDNSGDNSVTTIPANGTYVALTGSAEASDLTVTDGTKITGLNVKLYENGDGATYSLKIKNIGNSNAYLDSIKIDKTNFPSGLTSLNGFKYTFSIGSAQNFVIESVAGAEVTVTPNGNTSKNYITVEPNNTVDCKIKVEATDSNLFNGDTNVKLTLGEITINWTSVNPNTSA